MRASAIVSAAVVYDAATRTATLVPGSPAGRRRRPTPPRCAVEPAGPQIKDLAGNALAGSLSWSFTTAAGPVCPCGGWDPTATPANPSVADPNAVELGVKFTSDVNGFITGVRFYKGSRQHRHAHRQSVDQRRCAAGHGHLHGRDGVRLAAGELCHPGGHHREHGLRGVVLRAQRQLCGRHAVLRERRRVQPARSACCRTASSGGNGVYAYGAASSFPSSTYQASNYWVDVVFSTVGPADTTPPTVTRDDAGQRCDRRRAGDDRHRRRSARRSTRPRSTSSTVELRPARRARWWPARCRTTRRRARRRSRPAPRSRHRRPTR